jgi:hypothetical protein
MRTCPKCLKRQLDVTGGGIAPNPHYRCWNCGFECYQNQIDKFADFDGLIKKIESKPVKARKNSEHLFLIRHKYNGDVRSYLLSMDEFKE